MANQISRFPWSIDTASATAVKDWDINVGSFAFIDYDAAAHEVNVTDKNGNLVWHTKGNADLTAIELHEVGHVDGLIVDTLGSGKLMVYEKG